jgi:hypothetical protein
MSRWDFNEQEEGDGDSRLATVDDAMREYAWTVGQYPRHLKSQWILTDYDVWVRNPHYTGPSQPHPEAG